MAKRDKPEKNNRQAAEATGAEPRRLKRPDYRSFRLQKRIKDKGAQLPSSFRLLRSAFGTLKRHPKLFLGIILINMVLSVLLVQGFSAGSLNNLDTTASLKELFRGNFDQLSNSASMFMYLLGASGNGVSEAAGVYRVFVGLVVSLALIWALRQIYADRKIRIRDAFYQGMTPLVPFIMILLTICLQVLPMLFGVMLYTTVVNNGIAATEIEQLLCGVCLFLLALWSLYMISSSLFALYIVCLPGVTPLMALKSAKKLVAYRRWEVMRKVIFLPIALLLLAGLIMVPLIFISTAVASVTFFILSVGLLAIIHSYLYALYRAML